jgi:hypothetical protein
MSIILVRKTAAAAALRVQLECLKFHGRNDGRHLAPLSRIEDKNISLQAGGATLQWACTFEVAVIFLDG